VDWMKLLNDYVMLLWNSFQVDIWVFSQWWAYAFLCIPAVAYLIFFCMKWFVLTLPIWYIPAKIFGASPFGTLTSLVKNEAEKRKNKEKK
jgi:hypothetical protein